MDNILCHIVGLNDDIKNNIIKILNNKTLNLSIIDLDNITQKIINDKNMNLMYNKYEKVFEKSKMKGSNKSLNKKYKDIEKKMNQYWKNKFEIILKLECNKIKNKEIILLGLNIHFKNHRIKVKIDCKLKFFVRLNLINNAKKVIEQNLDDHRDEIIAGTGGIAEGIPKKLAGQDWPKFRPGGLNIVRAGGRAGMFSAVIGGWAASGEIGSIPVTKEITE